MSKLLLLIYLTLVVSSCQNERRNPNINAKDPIKGANPNTLAISKQTSLDSLNFLSFWKLFRKAALTSDTSQLINLTAFPIETRGSLDSDPTIEYSKKQFPKVFHYFLRQYNGDGLNGGTEFDIVKSTEIPKDKIIESQIRIGDMIFFLVDGKWKLNFLYLDYDAMDSINMKK